METLILFNAYYVTSKFHGTPVLGRELEVEEATHLVAINKDVVVVQVT